MRHLLRNISSLLGTVVATSIVYFAVRALWHADTTEVEPKAEIAVRDGSVAIAGCDIVRTQAGPTCRIPARSEHAEPVELVVWIEDEDLLTPLAVTLHTAAGRVALAHEPDPLWPLGRRDGTGTQLVIGVDDEGVLEITGETKTGLWRWAVTIEARPPTPRYDAIVARWDGGDAVPPDERDTLLAELEAIVDDGDAWEVAQARALMAEMMRSGELDAAARAFEDAYARTHADELALRCKLLRNLAELYVISGQDSKAEATLARMGADAEGCDALGLTHRHQQALLEGTLRLQQSRFAEATAKLLEAVHGVERMRTRRIAFTTYARLATAFSGAQLHTRAAEAFRRAEGIATENPGVTGCADEAALTGVAIGMAIDHHLGQARRGPLPDDTIDEVLRSECSRAALVDTRLRLQLAYLELLRGRFDWAEHWVDQAEHQLERDLGVFEPADRSLARQGQRVERLYVASIRGELAVARRSRPKLLAAQRALTELLGARPSEVDAPLHVEAEVFAARLAAGRADLSLERTGAPVTPADREGLAAARDHLLAAFLRQEELLRLGLLGLSTSRASARDAEAARLLVEVQLQLDELEDARCSVRLLHNRDARVLVDAASVMARAPHLVDAVRAAAEERRRVQSSTRSTPNEIERAKEADARARRDLLLAFSRASDDRVEVTYRALCEALPEPAEGEHVLAFHQDPRLRWWIFDWSRGEPARMPVDGGPAELPQTPAERAARLILPIRDRLAGAERIRLLASGATHEVPFEGLPWGDDGTTLEERFIVTWALDLPHDESDAGPATMPSQRVVVCTDDRSGGCEPKAPAAYSALREAIGRVWGTNVVVLGQTSSVWEVMELSKGAFLVLIGENTSLADLRLPAPPCASEGAGAEPGAGDLDPFLGGVMVGMTVLDAGAILSWTPPAVTVLESCATGPVDAASLGGAIGLGPMVVAAGGQQVLVTRNKVCHEESYEFVTALVEATAEHGHDLPRLVRAIREQVDPDYERRILVP